MGQGSYNPTRKEGIKKLTLQEQNKVALFVCNDLAGLLFLNMAVPRIKALGLEPAIFNTGDHKNRKFKIPSPEDVGFYNVELLRDTILPFAESANPNGAPNLSFRQLALKHGLEYNKITDVNDPAFVARIINEERMIGGVAARFLQVFEQEIIGVFNEKGFLWNFHSGLLPDYGGLLTPPRAIINGETEYGVTAHEIAVGIDKGAIINYARLPLDPNKPILELYIESIAPAVDMLIHALEEYKENGFVKTTPQPEITPPCYTNPTLAENAEFAVHGIIYANPLKTAHLLTSLFSEAGSKGSIALEQRLQAAIDKHETAKTPDVVFIQTRQLKAGEPARRYG